MQQPIDRPSASCRPLQTCVQVRLSAIYLNRNQQNLQKTLSAYALEGKPLQAPFKESEQVFYHFLRFDWEKTLQSLLVRNAIPFEIMKTFEQDIFRNRAKNKVYLVEDDLDILFALNVILEEAGFDVLLSHSAKPLMEEVIPPTDLFILDKCMPDGDGLEVYQKLRSRADTRNIPVIMISALRSVQPQAVAAGVDDFLEKPFSMNDLLKMVSKHTTMNH